MEQNDSKKKVLWWLGGWLLLNLFQAIFTELFHDEAYYWYLSSHIQMGYSEHAPGMMLLIALTRWIPGEIGVRLMPVLMNTLAIWVLYRLIKPERVNSFFLILIGIAGVHVAGFFVAPDAPLFFFAVLFWWAYERYRNQDSVGNSLLLGLVIALMLYSKYHGAMTVFFVVLSDLKLFTRRSFWIAASTALLLYFPHLIWLWEHDFGTFRFHLGERTPGAWYVGRTLEFLGGFVLLAGPLLSLLLIPATVLHKPANAWERGLIWSFGGILAFLTFMTFHNRVEANWAATAMIPLLILGYKELEHRPQWMRWARRLAVPSILLIMVLRVYLVWDFLPAGTKTIRSEFHGWPEWAMEVKEVAQGRPVVFVNWYAYPSKYAFYAGEEAYGTSNLWYHRTQISQWTDEASLQGKEAVIMLTDHFVGADTLHAPVSQKFYYQETQGYRSFSNIALATTDSVWDFSTGEINLKVTIVQTADSALVFLPEEGVRVFGHLFDGSRQLRSIILDPVLDMRLEPGIPQQITIPLGELKGIAEGVYRFTLSLSVGTVIPTRNSPWIEVMVKRE
ncbi:MAG: glycosyltransferase family 39 protein [Bacteroidia bacterium]|nr:glycosyltransferase family 39 protein [Bacteroidia bacterium]